MQDSLQLLIIDYSNNFLFERDVVNLALNLGRQSETLFEGAALRPYGSPQAARLSADCCPDRMLFIAFYLPPLAPLIVQLGRI